MLFSLGLRYLRFCCFQECWFWRDQRPQFENEIFSRIFSVMEGLGICLPYIRRYFQEHWWSDFFFRAQITQILLFWRMPVSERSKITVWEWHIFQNFFAMKVLCMCLPYVKRSFQERQWSGFFFRPQMSVILLFLRKPVSERSKITVWEQHLFDFFAMDVLLICLPYVKRYF